MRMKSQVGRVLLSLSLLLGFTALSSVYVSADDDGAIETSLEGVTMTKIGNPIFRPVDFHLFSAPIGTPETGFSEFATTLLSLLPEPNHLLNPALGVGPGDAHLPPYDTELAQGVAANGFVDKDEFTEDEFRNGQGIYLAFMVVPDPGETGASPDFNSGPIIPDTLFPFEITVDSSRNDGEGEAPGTFEVPALSSLSGFEDVDGHSHFPLFLVDNAEFFPPFPDPSPAADYEYTLTMLDQNGNGWFIRAEFEIEEDDEDDEDD